MHFKIHMNNAINENTSVNENANHGFQNSVPIILQLVPVVQSDIRRS